jgi:hypothetical protein
MAGVLRSDVTQSPRDTDGKRGALIRTILILVVVLGLAFAFALALTRRLISTWTP